MKKPQSVRVPRCITTALLLSLIFLPRIQAQTTARIDSLQRVLKHAKHDSVRVQAHAHLCYFLAGRDNDRARAHGRDALALAKRLGATRSKAVAFACVGFSQVMRGEPAEGRGNLETGLKHAVACRDGAVTVLALRGLGKVERQSGKPDLALSYYQRGLDIAGQRGDSTMIGTMLAEIGHIHHVAGRHPAALEAYQRAQRLFDRHGPAAAACEQLVNTGILLHNMGRLDSAEEHYTRGLRLAWTLKDSTKIAEHLHAIGVQYARRSDNREALKYFRNCLALRERLHNMARLAQSLGTIGSAYIELGELDSALVYHQRSHEIYEQHAGPPQGAFALSNIAKIMRMRGRTDTAIALLERSRAMFEAAGDRNNLLAVLGNIASARSDRGSHAEAIDSYRQILEMMEKSGNRFKMPFILGNIAREHHSLGQYAESMDIARRCLSLAEELGDKDSQIRALQTLSAVHLSQHRYETALSYLKRGIDLGEGMNSRRLTAEMHRDVGTVYRYQKRYDEALEAYSRALASFETLRMPMYIATVLRGMADVHNMNDRPEEALLLYRRSLAIEYVGGKSHARTLGEMSKVYFKRGDLDSAIILATQALERARERGDRDIEMTALYYLSAYSEKKGNFPKAYESLRLAASLRDTTMNAENLRSINEMEAKYSSAEKQRAIAQLEAEKQAQMFALAQKENQLAAQRFAAERNRHHAEILKQDRQLQQLELERSRRDLELRDNELKLHKLWKDKLTSERNYEASIASRETSLRNVLLLGLLMTLAVGFLSFKRIQSRRREAVLKAEAAEYRMKAAEAQALAMQVEIERRERNTQRRYTKQLIDTQERDRKRIAGALHDSLGQELLVIKNRTLHALQNVALGSEARAELEQIERMATAALQNVRSISHDLRPYQLDRVGLTKTLRATLQQLEEQTGLAIESAIDDIDGILRREDETNMYRIAQECLNNVLKHADASRATVRVRKAGDRISLTVSDNGKGIVTANPSEGFGMQNMRERAVMLGGEMRVAAEAGGGTTVEIVIPVGKKPLHEPEQTEM